MTLFGRALLLGPFLAMTGFGSLSDLTGLDSQFGMAMRVEVGLEVIGGLEFEICRVTRGASSGSRTVGFLTMTAEACRHLHEVRMPGVQLTGGRIVIGEGHVFFVVSDAVVAKSAVDVVLIVDLVIDDDAFTWSDVAVLRVALGTLRRSHMLGILRKMRTLVQRYLILVGRCEIQLSKSLHLVEQERDRVRVDRHMTGHTRDLAVRRRIVRDYRVILDLVTDLRAEPVARGHTQRDDHKRSHHQDQHTCPDDVARPLGRILEPGQRDFRHSHYAPLLIPSPIHAHVKIGTCPSFC